MEADQSNSVQFATYRDDPEHRKSWKSQPSPKAMEMGKNPWVPLALRPIVWIPFSILLLLSGIGLEIAFSFSEKNQGWPTKNDFTQASNVLHYLYTLPPVIIVAFFVAVWAWTDSEIKKMQPYVDLVEGDSPAKRSLLLDYTRTHLLIVWSHALNNKHFLVLATTCMALLTLIFQPAASALLQVRDTWLPAPDITVNNLAAIGLNQDTQFNDLTSFLTAAGYAGASVLYSLPEAPFVHGQYTVAPFELPTNIEVNSTVLTANTTAVKSDAGCIPVQVEMKENADGTWSNSVAANGCNFDWAVDRNATTLFGTDVLLCSPAAPTQFLPIVFWFFTYEPQAQSSATFCFPGISLWSVQVQLDLANGTLLSVNELAVLSSASNFSEFSGNVTGPPLNGRAYNGVSFNLTNPDRFVLGRQSATQLQLPAAVFQAATQSSAGLIGSFEDNRFVGLSSQVYTTYLSLIARNVYFIPTQQANTLQVKMVQKRVFLSAVSTHFLAAGLFILAIGGCLVQCVHRERRRRLRLHHQPGTIASAVSIGAQTGMADLLAGRNDSREMRQVLQDKKFRIDPSRMQIVMSGEEGYDKDDYDKFDDQRMSVFSAFQGNRFSRRLSKATGPPGTPKSPKSPLSQTSAK